MRERSSVQRGRRSIWTNLKLLLSVRDTTLRCQCVVGLFCSRASPWARKSMGHAQEICFVKVRYPVVVTNDCFQSSDPVRIEEVRCYAGWLVGTCLLALCRIFSTRTMKASASRTRTTTFTFLLDFSTSVTCSSNTFATAFWHMRSLATPSSC